MAKGTVFADFAGTYEEARAFAKERGFNAPLGWSSHGAQGLPMLTLPFANLTERETVLRHFAEHGWDGDSVIIRQRR